MEETETTCARKIHQWKFWKHKKEKMNKNKEKKRELTHFLGHYPLPKSVKGHGLSTERPITILQKE
jgi:hypothetical protein